MSKMRWGILGCGRIATTFATGLQSVPDAELIAVGSRSQEKADTFGAEFHVPHCHGSYASLANDPDVDVIYVATPHPMHADDSLLCLAAGKAVLCEKPFTVNAAQAEKVIDFAREKRLFLLEAHWTRFLPLMAEMQTRVQMGEIGELRMLQTDFGFRAGFDPAGRLFDPALGGGALLDIGCYCISLASMLFGKPTHISGLAHLGETGVDEQCAITLSYPRGELALLSAAIRTNTQHEAIIVGTSGRIKIHSPWWKPTVMTLWRDGKATEEISVPFEGNGFNYEAMETMERIKEDKLESAILPLNETLEIMRTMDTLRAQWGLKYPME